MSAHRISIGALVPRSKPRPPLEDRLGPYWPVIPEGFEVGATVTSDDPPPRLKKAITTSKDPIATILDWLDAQPRQPRYVELHYEEDASEQLVRAHFKRLDAAGITRLRVNLPDALTSACLTALPSIEHLDLSVWSAGVFDRKGKREINRDYFDLSPLGKMSALASLRLFGPWNGGHPVDLTILARCTALRRVSLQIPKLELAAPASLEDLNLEKVEELEGAKLTLKSVVVRGGPVEPLAAIAAADEVVLIPKGIKNVTPLPTLLPRGTRRLVLDVGTSTPITAKPLARCTSLVALHLDGRFKDLDALAKLTALEELVVGTQPTGKLDVSKMSALRVLTVPAKSSGSDVTVTGWKPSRRGR